MLGWEWHDGDESGGKTGAQEMLRMCMHGIFLGMRSTRGSPNLRGDGDDHGLDPAWDIDQGRDQEVDKKRVVVSATGGGKREAEVTVVGGPVRKKCRWESGRVGGRMKVVGEKGSIGVRVWEDEGDGCKK
ncbi:hypothetical protein BU17DRAFT_69375 [Hysterangium stoloniferum]|nr:hypothetical protein BU17DRAFT_69375 [Hysterangium stoloniferum]